MEWQGIDDCIGTMVVADAKLGCILGKWQGYGYGDGFTLQRRQCHHTAQKKWWRRRKSGGGCTGIMVMEMPKQGYRQGLWRWYVDTCVYKGQFR